MAQRRMVSLRIVDTDHFMDLPLSSQCLYFHLILRADDDGFIGNQKKILRMVGANDDDLKMLENKGFVIPFSTGVLVITHWKVHNLIRSDRYHETIYTEEKGQLMSYQSTYHLEPQVRLGKVSIGYKEPPLPPKGETATRKRFAPPTVSEVKEYGREYLGSAFHEAEKFIDFYTSKDWMIGKNKMKDWKAACRNWIRKDRPVAASEPKETERAQKRREDERLRLEAEKENVDMPDLLSAIRRN